MAGKESRRPMPETPVTSGSRTPRSAVTRAHLRYGRAMELAAVMAALATIPVVVLQERNV